MVYPRLRRNYDTTYVGVKYLRNNKILAFIADSEHTAGIDSLDYLGFHQGLECTIGYNILETQFYFSSL